MEAKPLFIFPKWSNKLTLGLLLFLHTIPLYAGALVAYGLDPVALNVGYAPQQPIPYSHALHAGQLGIDCRYCHNTVENSSFAAIPPTDTCINCHKGIRPNSEKLKPMWESFNSGKPIPWVKVHDLPDYVYFNHSAHVGSGVSCVECHGQVNHMEVVAQVKPLNMGWCLECHRGPETYLRPRDKVTQLDWQPTIPAGKTLKQAQQELGAKLKNDYHVQPNVDCITCHR